MLFEDVRAALWDHVPMGRNPGDHQRDGAGDVLDQWMVTTGAQGAVLLERPHAEVASVVCTAGRLPATVQRRFERAFRSDGAPSGGLLPIGVRGGGGDELLLVTLASGPSQPKMACGLHFEAGLGAPLAEIRARHQRAEPMLEAFFRLWRQHKVQAQRQDVLQAALDLSDLGIVSLGHQCQILFANERAERLLATRDGIARTHGVLRTTHLIDGIALHAALGDIGEGPSRARAQATAPLLSFRRIDGPPLVGALHPVRPQAGGADDAAAILYVLDPTIDAERSVAPLCRLHGLSRVETDLVCRLTEGATVGAAATAMRIREQTARGYLKQIFVKTGTKRQTELVARMLASLVRVNLQSPRAPISSKILK